MRSLAAFVLVIGLLALGCAAPVAQRPEVEHANAKPAEAPQAAAPAPATAADESPAATPAAASDIGDPTPAPGGEPAPAPRATAPAPTAAAPAPSGDASLPAEVDGGVISRGVLTTVLSAGIGRFLQRLRVERELEKGRFVGWRVTEYAAGDATLRSSPIQPGDTVLRVNGQSIERPEQFKDVWDSMATSSALVIDMRRGSRASQVRYRIVD